MANISEEGRCLMCSNERNAPLMPYATEVTYLGGSTETVSYFACEHCRARWAPYQSPGGKWGLDSVAEAIFFAKAPPTGRQVKRQLSAQLGIQIRDITVTYRRDSIHVTVPAWDIPRTQAWCNNRIAQLCRQFIYVEANLSSLIQVSIEGEEIVRYELQAG